jgi:O-succinylbenzoate synthase
LPTLFAHQHAGREITAEIIGHLLKQIVGHRMAKAAVEMAVLDAELRGQGESFARYFGATVERVPSGVSIGIHDSIPELLETVDSYLTKGYMRIKLKIKPGWEIAPVRAVRERFGNDVLLPTGFIQSSAHRTATRRTGPATARRTCKTYDHTNVPR